MHLMLPSTFVCDLISQDSNPVGGGNNKKGVDGHFFIGVLIGGFLHHVIKDRWPNMTKYTFAWMRNYVTNNFSPWNFSPW